MKQILRLSLALTLLFSSTIQSAVLPYLSIRSQSINDARELVGWQTQINKADMCHTYGSFSITPEYTRSFNSSRIAQALFCDALTENCCDRTSLKIQGSKVSNRDEKALMAENFYLPTDYNSIVTVKPEIDNFLVDFNMYLGLDGIKEGLFFRIHAPVVYTGWRLNYDETMLNAGTNAYDPGYFTSSVTNIGTINDPKFQGLPRTAMLNNFTEYATDGLSIAPTIGAAYVTTFDPLESARWSRCRKTRTGIADLRMQLGWNVLSCPTYHLGFSIQAAAPTGNRPLGQFLFEPIVGNGHHWELGGGLTFHTNICQNCEESCSWDVYLDANITHLFKTRQCRTFDLCGKPLSRYMLASKFGNTTPINLTGESANPSTQFANEFTPVANITTIPVNVSAGVQSDIVLKLAWTHCNFQWDLGYNFWARSCEKISRYTGPCCYQKFPLNGYALKGNAFVYGFPYDGTVSTDGIPLSATESNATIFEGTPTIDHPSLAYDSNGDPLEVTTAGLLPWHQVNTSVQPVFIKEEDLDLAAGQQRGISNKLFTHLGYTWADHGEWIPFVGIGGEVEWGRRNHKSNCEDSCKQACDCKKKICYDSCCQDFALSQWGVWVKGGVSFN